MIRMLIGTSLMLFVAPMIAPIAARAEAVSFANAAELSLHRIERLVILRRIDASFQKNFAGLSLRPLTAPTPADAAFSIRAVQVPGQDGTMKSLDMTFDFQGRALTQVVNVGADSVTPPAWPQKDAVTISEYALHWLQEEGPQDPALKLYNDGLTELAIRPELDAQGAIVSALVLIRTADLSAATLVIRMKLDATFDSHEFSRVAPPLEATYSSIKSQILEKRCLSCHGPGGDTARIPLAPLDELLASPRELVLPGNSIDSGLLIAITREDDKRMPPPEQGAPLTATEIETIARWIDEGARP